MSRAIDRLNAWILARKSEGYWVTCCLSCGDFFAQLHVGRRGRPAMACDRHRCLRWHMWRNKNGRAPPGWLVAKWRAIYGDAVRTVKPKAHAEPRFASEAA